MRFILDIALGLVFLGIFEGVIKPIASYYGRKQTIFIVSKLLQATDTKLPEIIPFGLDATRSFVLGKLENILEQENLTRKVDETKILSLYEQLYSPLKNALKFDN